MPQIPDRIELGEELSISRLVCGLWQVADLEKDGATLDPDKAANALDAYAKAGFDTFDMADHYGSAELITGRLLARYREGGKQPIAFTKWCPEPGPMTSDVVSKGMQERLDPLGVERSDLPFTGGRSSIRPARCIARNGAAEGRRADRRSASQLDAAHRALADGVPVATNEVSFSLSTAVRQATFHRSAGRRA